MTRVTGYLVGVKSVEHPLGRYDAAVVRTDEVEMQELEIHCFKKDMVSEGGWKLGRKVSFDV